MYKSTLLILAIFLSTSSVVFAQDYTGSYVLNANGNQITLTLARESGNLFIGTLKSTTGMQYEIDAEVEGGGLVGICFNNQGEVAMEARLSGPELVLTLVEMNSFFQPDYSKAKKLVLMKASSTDGKKPITLQQKSVKKSPAGKKADNVVPNYSAQTKNQKAQTATASSQEVSDENWGFRFRLPQGWKYKKDHQGAILGHDTIAGVILVMSLQAKDINEVSTQMQQGLHDAEIQLSLTGALKQVSQNAITGEYGGFSSGQQVKARSTGTLSPYGGVAYVIPIATPEKYGKPILSAADVIVKNLQFTKMDVSSLMHHFSGTWTYVSTNRTEWMTFKPNGFYSTQQETQFSGQEGDNWGNTDNWGAYGNSRSTARWMVRGNKRNGVITISHPDGTQEQLEYKVHAKDGHTYWREYFFNGYFYAKN